LIEPVALKDAASPCAGGYTFKLRETPEKIKLIKF